MGRWGKADFRGLKELEQRIDKLEHVDRDRLCREAAAELAMRLLRAVKKRTPVGVVPQDIYNHKEDTVMVTGKSGRQYEFLTKEAAAYQRYWAGYTGGTLRRAWTVLPIEKQGDTYVATIVNNTEYASYVEYGHRQKRGRYVPALGKSLSANWVEGRLMLTISEQQLEKALPGVLERKLYKALKEVF